MILSRWHRVMSAAQNLAQHHTASDLRNGSQDLSNALLASRVGVCIRNRQVRNRTRLQRVMPDDPQ